MGKIIAMANNKGGVAKTTTTLNLGVGLSLAGFNILLIDSDPQSNLTISFGFSDDLDENVGNYILGSRTWKQVLKTIDLGDGNKIDLLPAARQMEGLEKIMFTESSREKILKRALTKDNVKSLYDFILIDCGPNLGILTTNALCAADEFLIPFQAEFFAAKGTETILEFANLFREKELNPDLEFGGIIITKYHENMRGKSIKEFVSEIRNSDVGDMVYDTFIRQNIKLMESPIYAKSIFHYAPGSNGAQDYFNLVNEFLIKQNLLSAHGTVI